MIVFYISSNSQFEFYTLVDIAARGRSGNTEKDNRSFLRSMEKHSSCVVSVLLHFPEMKEEPILIVFQAILLNHVQTSMPCTKHV